VIDTFYANDTYEVLELAYASGRFVPATPRSPADRVRLPPNPVPWPDPGAARRHALVITGGMMAAGMKGAGMPGAGMPGGFPPGGGMPGGGMPGMSGTGAFWALNGHAGTEGMDLETPLFVFERGRTQVIAIANRTAWWHPIHLHGHAFCVLSRNGRALARRDLLDTTLLAPQESVEIAFVSDNPGDWMLHCHVLEHQATGMMATFRVA
jgi:FtsP/CotA-like multicopper oxidase with cupredoxin domain